MTASGYPFRHPLVWGLYTLCIVSLPIFYWVEKKAKEPILPMTFLTRLQPSLVLFGLFLCTAGTFARVRDILSSIFMSGADARLSCTCSRYICTSREGWTGRALGFYSCRRLLLDRHRLCMQGGTCE